MKTTHLAIAACCLFSTLVSCKKNSAPTIDRTNDGTFKVFTDGNVTTVQNLVADTIVGFGSMGPYGTGRYTFFSLEKGMVIPATDSLTDKWDLAFKDSKILTNSGVSRPGGLGGAYLQVGSFATFSVIPADSVFRTDSLLTPSRRYAITPASWYSYAPPPNGDNLLKPDLSKFFVVRTASGKYAKVQVTNYYKGGVTPASGASDAEKASLQRYYNFIYTYQPNGTKNF